MIGSPAFLDALTAVTLLAGTAVMEVYGQDFAVMSKDDLSPVTEADQRAEAIIVAALAKLAPEIPVIAEEACAAGHIPSVRQRFFLVDPVDGTREFISRNGDFTVNIGLIENGVPILGIVFAPARGTLYRGAIGQGAECQMHGDGRMLSRRPIRVTEPSAMPPRIVASRSHRTPETDRFIGGFAGASIVSAGSSLKFCLIAAGEADLYPRMGRTMQWDTAAGDAVLRAAGGLVTTLDGEPLRYGPGQDAGADGFANPWFIARGAIEVSSSTTRHIG